MDLVYVKTVRRMQQVCGDESYYERCADSIHNSKLVWQAVVEAATIQVALICLTKGKLQLDLKKVEAYSLMN